MATNRTYDRAAKARGLTTGQGEQLRQTRGLTVAGLREIPEGALRRAVRRLDYLDLARAREAFRLRQSRDERGAAPAGALPAALRELDSTRARSAAVPLVAGVPTGREVHPRSLIPRTAGLGAGPGGWLSLGPGNIGGRTRSIVIHPANANLMWAGSVAGGVWRTDDGGQSWAPVDDFMSNLAVCCMIMDPTDPNVIYAGTGEGFSNMDALRGAGIFRTTDGAHWQQLGSTTGAEFQTVNRLAISSDGAVLLAATRAGIFRSVDVDRLTWTQALGEEIADVDFHPTNPSRAVAGGLNNGQAYHSTDGGQTWVEATHTGEWSGRVEVTYAVKDPSRVYASIDVGSGEIWRSTNGGKRYTRRKGLAEGLPARYLGDQGWYDNVIWAGDPTDANLVIVGGVDLWKSTDGGNTLRDISTWWDRTSAHADQHAIVAHPGFDGAGNKTVFFGNDGGVFKTEDVYVVGNDAVLPRVNGWMELVNTYGVTQFYAGAGNAASGVIVGGAQDNGTLLFTPANGSEGWTEMFGGDGGWCAADASDPDFLYGEYVFLNVHRSTDGGATSEFISGQFWNGSEWTWKPVPFRIPDARNQNALFIAPFVLDPNEPNRLLAGGSALWRTNDVKTPNTGSTGPSWTAIKPSAGTFISALAIARGDSDVVWVGHEDGQVFKTTSATASTPIWQRVDHTGPTPLTVSRYCTGITIDAQDHDTVYLSFGGYTTGNVWKTTDGGATWANMGQSLPAAPVRALTLHPDHSNLVYLGAEVGLFASDDSGVNWSPTNEGPTNCSVDDLFWMDRALVCVTHGRGMFRIDLSGV
jgi:photosystem II stability/assembly factor-like uncharacterized protein